MSEDGCKNGCTLPLRFPRRPGENPLNAHGEGCFCCATESRISSDNRPSLPHFNYRIGSYGTIREWLLYQINQTPNLQNWTHREPDDPAIALLEGASILGDILTFYQETYANEAFLRTAGWRDSISDLVRLLGYRLSPAVGGNATFAFEIKKDDPVVIPAGFPLKATLEEFPKPSDLETKEEITAYPWLSRFNLYRPLAEPDITKDTTEFYISYPDQLLSPIELKAGDRLLVGVATASAPGRIDNSEIVIVDTTHVLHGTTLIKIKGALSPTTNATSLVAYKLGRSFRHFGHNGPQTKFLPPATVTATSTTLASTIQPPPVTIPPQTVTIQPPPVTKTPPQMTVTPPQMTVPLSGNSNDLIHSFRVTAPTAVPATIHVLPDIPIPLQWKTDRGTVTVNPPAMTVTPPAVTVTPPAVTAQSQPVTILPPLLPIPPQLITTTTNVPPLREESINFFRWLNYPANTFESVWSIVEPNLDMKEFPLDAEVQDLPAGVPLVAQFTAFINSSRTQKEERTLVRTIASVKPISMTWGLLTSNTSLVTLKDTLETPPLTIYLYTDIREFQFHETLSPQLTLKAAKTETTAASGNVLNFYGTAEQAKSLASRRIMFEKPDADPRIVNVTDVLPTFDPATDMFPKLHGITLSGDVTYADFPNEKPVTSVFGNLADADEGKTLPEAAIGSGDATLIFQNFKIPKAPLTYHIVPENTPSETPEAEIYVDGRMWRKVDSFFARKADEQIYIVREDADGNSWAQFGDGKTGTRLTNGIDNVTAIYRIGDGAFGPLKADTKVQASARIKNLDKIEMPSVATGGSPPEDGENARYAAPGKVQSLGRIVSLKDFESEAAAIPGVTCASAAWQLVDNIPKVVVTILMETGRSGEANAVGNTLNSYNILRGAGRTSIKAVQGRRKYVTVSIEYVLKPGFRADLVEPVIRLALGVNFAKATRDEDQTGLFSLRKRRFGAREYASTIEGTVQNVEGVLMADATAFTGLAEPLDPAQDDPTGLLLPNASILDPIVGCDGGHILSLYDKHLFLRAKAEGS